MTLEYRKNGRAWQAYKTVNFATGDGRKRIYCTKLLRANEYQWRIRSSSGNFKLMEYKLDVSASEQDKNQ